MKFTTTMLTLLALATAALAVPVPLSKKTSNSAVRPLVNAAAIRPAVASSISQKVAGSRVSVHPPTSKRIASTPGGRTTTAAGKRLAAKEKAAERRLTPKDKTAGKKTAASKKKVVAKKKTFLEDAFAKPEAHTKSVLHSLIPLKSDLIVSRLFGSKDKINRIKDSNGEGEMARKLRQKATQEATQARNMLKNAKNAKYATTEDREAAIERAALTAQRARKDRDDAIRYGNEAKNKRVKLEQEVKTEIQEGFKKTYAQVVKQNSKVKKLESDLAGI